MTATNFPHSCLVILSGAFPWPPRGLMRCSASGTFSHLGLMGWCSSLLELLLPTSLSGKYLSKRDVCVTWLHVTLPRVVARCSDTLNFRDVVVATLAPPTRLTLCHAPGCQLEEPGATLELYL